MQKKLNVREYNNKQMLLFPASIGDFLPDDHIVHVVDEIVENLDLSSFYDRIPSVGNPSYHPRMMIKVLFYAYMTGTYSSRKIEQRLHTDIGFIYLSGMQKPDFKTISEFRRRFHKELRGIFSQILLTCHRLGMTRLGEISIDSKVVKGNASVRRSYDERRLEREIERYLRRAREIDEEEDRKYGSDKRGDELPEDISDRVERAGRIKEEVKKLEEAREKMKEMGSREINLTDNDARMQNDKGKIIAGYRLQVAVDSKEQVIVACDVTNSQEDSSELIPMVEKVLENVGVLERFFGFEVERIKTLFDSGYFNFWNFVKLLGDRYRKVDLYIPDQVHRARERGKRVSPFDKGKFVYDEDLDEYICPGGRRLRYVGSGRGRRGRRFRVYQSRGCDGCVYFGECTSSVSGRKIKIYEGEELVKRMREKLCSEEGRRVYSLRRKTVEPVLGNLTHNFGFGGFLLRGLEKVKSEFTLLCIAHNLFKIARYVKELRKGLEGFLSVRDVIALGFSV
jgi:transposase